MIRGSSNGRTPGFGPGYLGSNPGPRATKNRLILVFLLYNRRANLIEYSAYVSLYYIKVLTTKV
jgi:hypothetical protein